MGRCDFQTARTELDVHITVFDDGDDTVHQRHDDLAALEPLVLRVLGVDTHGGIAHDRLRTGGGHDSVVATVILVDDIAIGLEGFLVIERLQVSHIIFQVEEVALLLFVDDLLGGEGGEGLGIPVHHTQTTVDEAFVIEIDEDLDDALGTLLVHGEGSAVPVAAGT